MRTWVNVLAVYAVLALAAVEVEVKGYDCPQYQAGRSAGGVNDIWLNFLKYCVKRGQGEQEGELWDDAKTLDDFRKLFKNVCPEQSAVRNYYSQLTSDLTSCQNNSASLPFMIYADSAKHLLTAGCDQDGELLPLIFHGTKSFLRSSEEERQPITQCVRRTVLFLNAIFETKIDPTSQSYLLYKELPTLKTCLNFFQDESYKRALQWLLDELITNLKCIHPSNGDVVLCSDLDVGLVKVSNTCGVKQQTGTDLYDVLEEEAIGCYSEDESDMFFAFESLGDYYYSQCYIFRGDMACNLEKYYFAERCLSQEKSKQFQLFREAVNETIYRGCRDDGVTIGTIMHAVYQMKNSTPDSGHAVKDCLRAVKAARGQNTTSFKTMRLYYEMADFKRCLSDKLHADSNLAQAVGDLFNDVRKKIKCVNPNDASTVPCETSHTH